MEIVADEMKRRPRRNSAIDAIHVALPSSNVSPGQLYSTDSGLLYHAGRLAIIMVGLPARGKTHHTVALTRYLRWLGVKTHAFHLGDYRRKLSPQGFKIPDDYFVEHACEETIKFRRMVIDACLKDIDKFFQRQKGQVAIYDAVNPTSAGRRRLAERFKEQGVETLFVECLVTDKDLVARNIRDVKISSPDYQNMDPDHAVAHYLRSIELRIPDYVTMAEPELTWVKLVNVSEKFIINSGEKHLGYLFNRIIFFLMNSRIKVGSVFFARSGSSTSVSQEDSKSDEPLSEEGKKYANALRSTLYRTIESRKRRALEHDSKEFKELSFKLDQFKLHECDRAVTPGKISKNRRDYFGDTAAGDVGSAARHHSKLTSANSDFNNIENPYKLSQQDLGRRMQTQSKVTREYLKSLGAAEIDAVSTPVTSGQSTPLSPADALAMSTIRADDFNDTDKSSLQVWCSTRLRTVQTAQIFANDVANVIQRPQLNQLNPGESNGMSQEEIKRRLPLQYNAYSRDPYHHRFQRGESYQDVATRLEPLILEMEGHWGDLLIIAHESVLRVLYGYLMACSVDDIPFLEFPRSDLVVIHPNAYINQATRIPINDEE